MNTGSPEYQANLFAHYTEAMKGYLVTRPQDRVRGYEKDSRVAYLDKLECEMLDNPPMGCRKGLVLPGEIEQPRGVPTLKSLTLEQADIKVLSDSEAMDIIASSDRTPPDSYVTSIHFQGNVGSCAGEAASGANQCRRSEDGKDAPALNGYFPYHWSSGGSDRGSTLHDNLAVLQEYGCASEDVFPRSKGWRSTPSDDAMQDALNYRLPLDGVVKVNNRMEFITMVLSGFPVQFGYTGHSIFCSDIVDLQRLTYVNSWGDWGNNGRGTLSFDRVYWNYGCYAVIAAREKN